MPFRDRFDCLWCGTAWSVRAPNDLEGWAQLCPDCVGKAGDNGFLRFRVREALAERAATAAPRPGMSTTDLRPGPTPAPAPGGGRAVAEAPSSDVAVADLDDWYLRRGRFERGPIHDAAWNAELDAAGRWLDELPLRGPIVELAAGTGWWSPLLAGKGELWIHDAAAAPLERATERLVAHGLRAHVHVRDPWAEPDRPVNALFTAFWLSRVPRGRLDEFLRLARRWVAPGGVFAFIDSLPDRAAGGDGAQPGPPRIPHAPAQLRAALVRAGFVDAEISETGRFFVLGAATA